MPTPQRPHLAVVYPRIGFRELEAAFGRNITPLSDDRAPEPNIAISSDLEL